MAKTCAICDKGTRVVGSYSNRVRATQYNPTGKKRKKPNLVWAPLPDGGRIEVCAKCLKKGKPSELKRVK